MATDVTMTIRTDTTQAELAVLKSRLAMTDMLLYAELVHAYRVMLKCRDSDLCSEGDYIQARGEAAGVFAAYMVFSGQDADEISRELTAELG